MLANSALLLDFILLMPLEYQVVRVLHFGALSKPKTQEVSGGASCRHSLLGLAILRMIVAIITSGKF